ncbi:TlpA disulfide reductase family protein [uncultured Draconibacterium sp.]|uniref:TlpA family protein disulfide reductase n=1 Tax=uncultured Draconibacterium sp. TaxID=1573823 RepID=UPI0025F901D9|nr:TlpA disulfide reductase family protein [uncultured Draconibacterium sp.]
MKQLSILIFITFFSFSSFAQDAFTLVKEGELAPDFTILLEDGSEKQLSDLKGKVVWINFFADWCPPCRKELPHLDKEVYEKFKDQAFEVLVIGREHDWTTVNNFKKEKGYKMPFYPDPKREIFSKYAKQNIPRNFIIDKQGKIIVSSIGFNEKEFKEMIAKVKELL